MRSSHRPLLSSGVSLAEPGASNHLRHQFSVAMRVSRGFCDTPIIQNIRTGISRFVLRIDGRITLPYVSVLISPLSPRLPARERCSSSNPPEQLSTIFALGECCSGLVFHSSRYVFSFHFQVSVTSFSSRLLLQVPCTHPRISIHIHPCGAGSAPTNPHAVHHCRHGLTTPPRERQQRLERWRR